ncbi:MAG: ABC transporter ATP-binding protein [Deltaproteobacteria bacterium]|nr:ABC transporter ATP-binding protein [Deltaproteobacteria bacterium]
MTPKPTLVGYLRPLWPRIAATMGAVVVMSAINVGVIPVVQKIAEVITLHDSPALLAWISFAVAIYLVRAAAAYVEVTCSLSIGHHMVAAMRTDVFAHLQTLSLDFFARKHTGDLLSRIINDLAAIQSTLTEAFVRVLPHILTPFGVLAYLFYINWKLTLVALAMAAMVFFLFSRFRGLMRDVGESVVRNQSDMAVLVTENIRGAKIVRSFCMEKSEIGKMALATDASLDSRTREARIIAIQEPLVGLFQILLLVSLIGLGGHLIIKGEMTPAQLVAFFIGMMLLIDPVREMSRIHVMIQRTRASASRVLELLEETPSVPESPEAVELGPQPGAVEFSNVSFAYEKNGPTVLSNVSLRAEPGQTLAIVGPSGAGKTTLANLVCRFCDPSLGAVLVNGQDVRSLTLASLRSAVGLVPQDTVLFSHSVRENIALGKPGASGGEIERAARLAHAHEFIASLPDGYETRIGENGVLLSEGQRQRIAIARCFLKDPAILVLDEITASLDAESERLIQDALRGLMAGRTTLLIAHRLSTVAHADRIVFLDKGAVAEQGTHRELFEKRGAYWRFCRLQWGVGRDSDIF